MSIFSATFTSILYEYMRSHLMRFFFPSHKLPQNQNFLMINFMKYFHIISNSLNKLFFCLSGKSQRNYKRNERIITLPTSESHGRIICRTFTTLFLPFLLFIKWLKGKKRNFLLLQFSVLPSLFVIFYGCLRVMEGRRDLQENKGDRVIGDGKFVLFRLLLDICGK